MSSIINFNNEENFFGSKDVTEERLNQCLPKLREYIAFFREYPDYFVDFLRGDNPKNFNLFFYQRVYLRSILRYRYVYAVFPRAYSKSFLAILGLMIKCVLYPGCHLFVSTGGKEQAASITREKVNEICKFLPGLRNEIVWGRGADASKESKNLVVYKFHNGSILDILAGSQMSRGQRRHGGLLEECILIDHEILNTVLIPTMNVDRRLPDGSTDTNEPLNKSQVYITTAGWKATPSYDKLKQLLIQSAIFPEDTIVIGGTYRVPRMEGLLSRNFVADLKADGTFNEVAFEREYESVWQGDSEGSFFSSDDFDKCRELIYPEECASKTVKNGYYVIGADIGRKGCATEICVFRVAPQVQGGSIKALVNLYSLENQHFEDQAIFLKKIFYKFKARRLVIDGNGLGIGIIDYMVKSQIDPETGDTLPDFGIYNDDEGFYKQFKTSITEHDAVYIIKANPAINSEAYSYCKVQFLNSHVKLLIDEVQGKNKLASLKRTENMNVRERQRFLRPYTATTILRDQALNMVQKLEGVNIKLEPANKHILHDKLSAFIYGMYYIYKEEDSKKKRNRDLSKMILFG